MASALGIFTYTNPLFRGFLQPSAEADSPPDYATRMPVYLFTLHAYRTWVPDRPQGYVRRGKGILPPDEGLAIAYSRAAREPQAGLGEREQGIVLAIAHDACFRRNWRLHAIACEATHTHLLVTWSDTARPGWVGGKLKNLISRELNWGLPEKRKWLSRSASRRRVRERSHFEHLVQNYLPGHGGLFWKEGMAPPGPPASAGG